jgi:transposase-like protein
VPDSREASDVVSCPFCRSTRVTLHFSEHDVDRYRCADCGKFWATFSKRLRSLATLDAEGAIRPSRS